MTDRAALEEHHVLHKWLYDRTTVLATEPWPTPMLRLILDGAQQVLKSISAPQLDDGNLRAATSHESFQDRTSTALHLMFRPG